MSHLLEEKEEDSQITLSDEDTSSDSENEDYGRALISCETKENLKLSNNDELLLQAVIEPKSSEELEREGVEEDQIPLLIPPSNFEELLKVRGEYENLMKLVRLLTPGTQSLEDVLNMGKQRSNREGLGYDNE
ncbi:hypothetical protein E5676_scaffold163G001040 [Cucumis melo var. makuwa]|uniref:Uncharacterized protein n=1 Tax=Cucumis melo var. makuwa TaxID=1194695 RepID=A0A5A7U9H3_CUCMM|nr:hypothetical protein E6C27_scaffold675G001780 [Cucumis melo var. makuwa]TYK06405.1 hypothetical protein E5676_scaffold163G001040 [Cucumis melo var. makuwa]